jgi:hypothetical protein
MSGIEALRLEAREILSKDPAGYAIRSCWNCNQAHEHLKKVDYPIYCIMGCGHWFYKGADITQNNENDE